jgi:hypothetical protein
VYMGEVCADDGRQPVSCYAAMVYERGSYSDIPLARRFADRQIRHVRDILNRFALLRCRAATCIAASQKTISWLIARYRLPQL